MQTALHSILSGSGAQFREIAGWEVPESFGNPEAEYWALRRASPICRRAPSWRSPAATACCSCTAC
jgi:hypothetical protein